MTQMGEGSVDGYAGGSVNFVCVCVCMNACFVWKRLDFLTIFDI
jgi:hypothetical protein